MRSTRAVTSLLLVAAAVAFILAPAANAEIKESFWELFTSKLELSVLKAGETREYKIIKNGEFVLEGVLADGATVEIKCTKISVVGLAGAKPLIVGGMPGTGKQYFILETCSLEKPEKWDL